MILRAKIAADIEARLMDQEGGIRQDLTDEDRAVIDTLLDRNEELSRQIRFMQRAERMGYGTRPRRGLLTI